MAVTPLPWDTDFFGARIGRADLSRGELGDVVAEARRAQLECVYLFVDGVAVDVASEAVHRGGRIVDLRTVLEADASQFQAAATTRLATPEDRAALIELASALSESSRFRADRRFDARRVADMYRVWIEQCLDGGVVAVPNDSSAGLVGVRTDGDEAHVELVYTAANSRGRGVARALVSTAVHASGASSASVATQAGNVAAQRLYEGLGFRTRSFQFVLHLWLDELR